MSPRLSRTARASRAAAATVAAALAAGCAGDVERSYAARAIVLDQARQPLVAGTPTALRGQYGAGCVGRAGAWTLALEGRLAPGAPSLTVVEGDAACALTITAVVTGGAVEHALPVPLRLRGAWASSPAQVSEGETTFWINARLDSTAMDRDFTVTILYADEPGSTLGRFAASHQTIGATSSVTSNDAPDYAVDLETDPLTPVLFSDRTVSRVDGAARFVVRGSPGQAWAVDLGTLSASPTAAEVNEAYAKTTPTAIAASAFAIPGSAFGLDGLRLASPTTRTVLVRGGSVDLPTYQLVRITFAPPS